MTAFGIRRKVHRPTKDRRQGLPSWVYHDPDFFALEREHVFMRSWQVVCHENDVPASGDYHRFDFLGESVVVVRGDDDRVRAFHNVCQHRAARLLDGEQGSGRCANGVIRCPYHAWTYDLQGRLKHVPEETRYGGLVKANYGLVPVELETWQGFVFVRFEPGGPSVADMMAPFEAELLPYRLEELYPLGRVTLRPREVNWKTVTDNYVDGLHIRIAHDGLRRLTGRTYKLDSTEYVQRMTAAVEAPPTAGWSERLYCAVLPEQKHLAENRRRMWCYYMMWPNIAFDVYPDQVDFMQMIPLGPENTLIREIPYGLRDSSRAMRLTRYLNWRVNRVVNTQDHDLITRVQAGMRGRGFVQGPLSDAEICLSAFADKLRAILPVSRLPKPPGQFE